MGLYDITPMQFYVQLVGSMSLGDIFFWFWVKASYFRLCDCLNRMRMRYEYGSRGSCRRYLDHQSCGPQHCVDCGH